MKSWQDLQLVEIIWIDASIDESGSGFLDQPGDAKQFGGLALCSDVGYLIRKDRQETVLAVGLIRDTGEYRHSNTIPTKWVKQLIYLTREAPDGQQHNH